MFNVNSLDFEQKSVFLLAQHLDLLSNLDDVSGEDLAEIETYTHYNDGLVINIDGEEWVVYPDYDEAEKAASEDISQLLWAFNAGFLASATGLPECVFEALQGDCEGSNDTFEAIIQATCGLEEFTESAISDDGLGHFLSSYNGEELEINDLYFFRLN